MSFLGRSGNPETCQQVVENNLVAVSWYLFVVSGDEGTTVEGGLDNPGDFYWELFVSSSYDTRLPFCTYMDAQKAPDIAWQVREVSILSFL